MPNSAAIRMIALLERERAALIRGELSGLDGFAREKEALLTRLGEETPSPAAARKLALASARNQRLLGAALAGLKSAARRLTDDATISALTSYDERGQLTRTEADAIRLNRRL